MKNEKDQVTITLILAYMTVWICSCIAISIGLYFTKDIKCLWFLLLPSFVSIHSANDKKSDDNNQE